MLFPCIKLKANFNGTISLLRVVGKVFGRILRKRIRERTEGVIHKD